MVAWTNRVVYQFPRNGTTLTDVDTTSSVNLVSGTPFTPTPGRLLVALIAGAVTSTTPSGWTLPSGGSAIYNAGIYVWYRTAATGSNIFSSSHNGSNYPIPVAVYEFPSGSTFLGSVAAPNISPASANPTYTGLTGTNLLMAAFAQPSSSGVVYASTAWTGATEDIDVTTPVSGTDGYGFSLGYEEGVTAASWAATGAITFSSGASNKEALTFAINVAAGGTDYPASVGFASVSSFAASGSKITPTSVTMASTSALSVTARSRLVASMAAASVSGLSVNARRNTPASVAIGSVSAFAASAGGSLPTSVAMGSVSAFSVAAGGPTSSVTFSSTSGLAVAASVARPAIVAFASISGLTVTGTGKLIASVAFGSTSLLRVTASGGPMPHVPAILRLKEVKTKLSLKESNTPGKLVLGEVSTRLKLKEAR